MLSDFKNSEFTPLIAKIWRNSSRIFSPLVDKKIAERLAIRGKYTMVTTSVN